MKRFIAMLLAAMMVFSLAACTGDTSGGNSNPPSQSGNEENSNAPSVPTGDPYKIAVATIQEGESWEVVRTYLNTVVGPALNMEFMMSEKLSDANGLVAFMEQAYVSGCVGVINMVTAADAVAQGAQKAEEWGMWFITENSALVEDVAGLSHNLGHVGADPVAIGTAYKKAFSDMLSDGEKHSVFLFSGAAVGGDIGQGAASHFYSAKGVLEAFQETYNLTYAKSISEIINTQDPGEIETGDPDVHIYIYPGFNPGDAVTAALPVLQTGNYDIFAAVFSFPAFTNAIADVETSLGKNIKVIGTAQIEAQSKTGFESKDPTGDSVLNGIVLNDLSLAKGIQCVALYNALNGASEAMKDNGKAVFMGVRSWACEGADVYAKLEKLNTSSDLYILTAEDLQALTVTQNPNATWKDLEGKLAELADLDALLAAKGL